MKTRYSVYKYGYVHEDGTITEDKLQGSFINLTAAKYAKNAYAFCNNNPEDYYIVKEEFDGIYWVTVEGTEIY